MLRVRAWRIAGIVAALIIEPACGVQASAPCSGCGDLGFIAVRGNDFSSIASNMTTSAEDLPGLLTGLVYLMGVLLGVSAIISIKDYVENPAKRSLREGLIRLASGGALFALPIIFEAMTNTTGSGVGASAAVLYRVHFNIQ